MTERYQLILRLDLGIKVPKRQLARWVEERLVVDGISIPVRVKQRLMFGPELICAEIDHAKILTVQYHPKRIRGRRGTARKGQGRGRGK